MAMATDLPECAPIINDYIDETEWLPRVLSHERIAAIFVPELLVRRRLLVAEQAGRVAGYLSLATDGFVPAIYVLASLRGRGLGRALLDAAKALSPEGLELAVFEANVPARRFYAREGFHELQGRRETATEEGIATLRLRWKGPQHG